MFIDEHDANLDESRTLKVTLPTRLHLQLHSLKILSGRTISQTVEEAVEAYLEEDDAPVQGKAADV